MKTVYLEVDKLSSFSFKKPYVVVVMKSDVLTRMSSTLITDKIVMKSSAYNATEATWNVEGNFVR